MSREEIEFYKNIEKNTRVIGPYELAQEIFSKTPGRLNSIDLQIEEQPLEGQNEFIQKILGIITLEGIRILFGHTNIINLTKEEIYLVKRYTRSYGYDIEYNVNEETKTIFIKFIKVIN